MARPFWYKNLLSRDITVTSKGSFCQAQENLPSSVKFPFTRIEMANIRHRGALKMICLFHKNTIIFNLLQWRVKVDKSSLLIPTELWALPCANLYCLIGQWIIWILRDRKHWNEISVMPGSIVILVQKIFRIISEQGRCIVDSPCKTKSKIHTY